MAVRGYFNSLKDRAIRALRNDRTPSIGRFLRGHREVGYVVWDASAPTGISHALHKLTLMDAIELASRFLQTDYSTERESILCGPQGRCYIFSLPQFQPQPVDGLYPFDAEANAIRMGTIYHRQVHYHPKMPSDAMLVFNTNNQVCRFLIQNAQ